MEKYEKAQMEVIEFESEDVITTSSIKICTSTDYDTITPDPSDKCIWGDWWRVKKKAARIGVLPSLEKTPF